MAELVQAGKVRYLEDAVLPVARRLGIGIVSYSPLGRGFLTGEITSPNNFAPDDFRRTNPRFQGEHFRRNLDLVDEVRRLADEKHVTAGQLALAWLLAQGEDIVPIPGTKRRVNLEQNAGACTVTLSTNDLQRLEAIAPNGVLVDSTVLVERHWRMWAAQHGLDSEFILANAHGRRTMDTLRTVASHLNLDLEQEAALLEKREVADTEGLLTVPGAVELLLARPCHSWAIVTSGSRMLATTRLQAVGLPIPQVLVTAEVVCLGKPHPEGYLKAATLLGLEPQNCLVIEDAPAGIQAAHAAGSRVIAVTTTFSVADVDEADFVVPELSSVHLTFTEHGTSPPPLLTLSMF